MTEFPPRESFENWLDKRPANAPVAERWMGCDCPLAVWLKELGLKRFWISTLYKCVENYHLPSDDRRPGVIMALPEWAFKFARYVDDTYKFKSVTALQCRSALTESAKYQT